MNIVELLYFISGFAPHFLLARDAVSADLVPNTVSTSSRVSAVAVASAATCEPAADVMKHEDACLEGSGISASQIPSTLDKGRASPVHVCTMSHRELTRSMKMVTRSRILNCRKKPVLIPPKVRLMRDAARWSRYACTSSVLIPPHVSCISISRFTLLSVLR